MDLIFLQKINSISNWCFELQLGQGCNLLQMCGKQVIFMNVAIIGSLINIVLNYTLIPLYGIDGSAIATMISLVVFNLLLVYFVKKEFGFYTFYVPFFKSK